MNGLDALVLIALVALSGYVADRITKRRAAATRLQQMERERRSGM